MAASAADPLPVGGGRKGSGIFSIDELYKHARRCSGMTNQIAESL